MLTEAIVGMAVIATLLGGFAITLGGFRNINHFYLNQQRCIAAAQAQLDSIAVTGKPLDAELADELWPKVNTSTEKTPGQGQWQGLTLVKVTATAKTYGREVTIEMTRYIGSYREDK